jgi:hypothetical protein
MTTSLKFTPDDVYISVVRNQMQELKIGSLNVTKSHHYIGSDAARWTWLFTHRGDKAFCAVQY